MVLYARDIVERDFLCLPPGKTIIEGAKAMKETRRGFAVIGTLDAPQGVVTEWDILSRVVAEGLEPQKVTMGEIMSKDILSIDGAAALSAVSQLMSENGVRRLIVKEKGQVIGFITSKTMLRRMNEYVDRISTQISRLQSPWF